MTDSFKNDMMRLSVRQLDQYDCEQAEMDEMGQLHFLGGGFRSAGFRSIGFLGNGGIAGAADLLLVDADNGGDRVSLEALANGCEEVEVLRGSFGISKAVDLAGPDGADFGLGGGDGGAEG